MPLIVIDLLNPGEEQSSTEVSAPNEGELEKEREMLQRMYQTELQLVTVEN